MLLEGVAASPGVAIGRAYLFHRVELDVPTHTVPDAEIELQRFESALKQTRRELEAISKRIEQEMPEDFAGIFRAHLMLLDDPIFVSAVFSEIKSSKVNAAFAVKKVVSLFGDQFSRIDNDYIKGRIADIRDVGRRLIQNLLGKEKMDLSSLDREVIVIAHDLSPCDTALMNKDMVKGFATDVGSRTSHTAIMARALEIPAVVGLGKITSQVQPNDLVIIDGNHGKVFINPDSEIVEKYIREQREFYEFGRSLEALRDLPAETEDNYSIELSANIEVPEEASSVKKYGAKGIGLYRTEYLYIRKKEMPSEDEQYESYRDAVREVMPDPVIIRTLDLGGDKFASYLEFDDSVGSMMGLRAIRLCLQRPDIFMPQLRAILRASAHGNLWLMFPMISSVEEFRQAKVMLERAKAELAHGKIPFNPNLKVGVMIEVPAAAMIADILAKEADFFSIGTNDLIQYTLAVHRVKEEIAHLYEPLHPAVLRLIQHVVDAAKSAGIWVGMCGEMASDPIMVPLLLGMGLDELSMSPSIVPEIKKIIRSLTMREAQEILKVAMSFSTAREIESYAYDIAMDKFPEVLAWIDRKSSQVTSDQL